MAERQAEYKNGDLDPSVIVGLACRVPGSKNPSQLWDAIVEQRDLRRKIPENRFNVDKFYHPDGTNKGTTNARYGYFLDQDLGDFDASFFGISGSEAKAMDPQQRILLEVVYEALEDAGITLDEINGSSTSVLCGSFTNDYNAMLSKDFESYPKYTVTGTGNAILSNRISYFYNLHGTSLTVDTACSSSMVCLHLANKALLDGEADMSIVVGSSLHFDSDMFVTMTDLGMLSTDGRCRAFDAAGSGYVRGEGICAVILKRQSSAILHGDSIHAVVRGTGSNHDGQKPGITFPNSVAQEALIRSTYQAAGLDPADTQYFEAHGTGTQAGDPNETRAVGAVFSDRQEPLFIGSLKSNIGHLEGASGVASVIKTTLALQKGKIPPNMHFNTLNPKIDLQGWKLAVPTELVDWPRPENGLRRASINSFGYGGTNAHVVLEEYLPAKAITPMNIPEVIANGVHDRPYLLPLTSHSTKAGELWEKLLRSYLINESPQLPDVAFTLSHRRTMHRYRSFIVSGSLQAALENTERPRPYAPWSQANSDPPRLGFVFTGQGAQWHAMGRQLIQECPLFRQTLERCDSILQSLPDAPSWYILEELCQSENASNLGQTLYSQTICTALQIALVDLMKCWAVVPSGVVGHSSGEIGAAYAAGILSFENAMVAAYYRGLYMSSCGNSDKVPGAMMAVGMNKSDTLNALEPFVGRIVIAAINSANTITVSGDEDAIIELKNDLDRQKIFARQLQVKQAFHSHHMVPLAPAYRSALQSYKEFDSQSATCQMFSTVTARVADPEAMGANYWAANMTNVVRFSDGLAGTLLDEFDEKNVDILVEVGPHPALKGPCKQIMQSLKLDLPYVATLTRGTSDFESMLTMAGQLFSLGYPIDLAAVNQNSSLGPSGELIQTGPGKKLKDFPSYAWDHKRYWSDTRVIREHRLRRFRHSILGHILPGSVASQPTWRNILRISEIPWLAEHIVDGKTVFPAAGYISMAIEAAIRQRSLELNEATITLQGVSIKAPLIIEDGEDGVEVLLNLCPTTTSAKERSESLLEFCVSSYNNSGVCIEHCRGVIFIGAKLQTNSQISETKAYVNGLLKRTNYSVPAQTFYRHLSQIGLDYGDRFKLLTGNIDRGNGFAVSSLVFNPQSLPCEEADVTVVHPTLLDSSFHLIFSAIESCLDRTLDEPYVPSFIRSMVFAGFSAAARSMDTRRYQICSATKMLSPRVAISDILLQDETGSMTMQIDGLEVKSLGGDQSDSQMSRSLFFRQQWLPCFDLLSYDPQLESRSLAEIVEIFAHQYPNSRLLHIVSSIDESRQLVHTLGLKSGQRRKVQSIDVCIPEGSGSVMADHELISQSGGLLNILEPDGVYDLLIVSRDTVNINLDTILKPNGSIIQDHSKVRTAIRDDYQVLFSSHGMTAYRRHEDISPAKAEEVSVVIPDLLSGRVQDIVNSLRSVIADINLVSLKEVVELDQLNQHGVLLVLASLGGPPQDEGSFRAFQKILTSIKRKVIWALEGATMDSPHPDQAMFLGLIRTARSENDQLQITTVDYSAKTTPIAFANGLVKFLNLAQLDEDELTERDGCIYLPKIVADDECNRKLRNGPNQEPSPEMFGSSGPLTLKIGKIGLLDTFHFERDEDFFDEVIQDDEIEIQVKASPISARDVAVVTGTIDSHKLGDECAGIVTRIGNAVENFSPGDRVIAWRPGQGAHRTLVRNPAALSYKLTESMPFSDAAAVPIAVTTSWYALSYVARVQAGETVLIHCAASSVGQIAVQIAVRAGARILVTVGTPEKRSYMKRQYGLQDDQIFDSREKTFVKGVLRATQGNGVDVVLNCLSGPLFQASCACVKAFGRLIELGKRDIQDGTLMSMEFLRKNISIASVDLVNMFESNKPLAERVFQEACELVHKNEIQPLSDITTFSYADLSKGFHLAKKGEHFHKIVLVPGNDDIVPIAPPRFLGTKLFQAQKTYLLVGGLGGVGRTLSQWMIRKGARSLAFFSRSGDDQTEAKATVAWLQERDISVTVYRGDVTNIQDVQNCVKKIGISLGGVIHAAMVIQDATLDTMTFTQWQRCIRPKVDGAQNLHLATLSLHLDFFVCFSSVTSIIGSKGLANYSAANAFLDALIAHRRARGLCGSTLNVGAVSNVGVIAESENLQKVMERLQMDFISEEELLYQLQEAIKPDIMSDSAPVGIDKHQTITGINLQSADVYWAQKPLFRNLYANHDFEDRADSRNDKSIAAILAVEPDSEARERILVDTFIDKVSKVLEIPREIILPNNSLSSYGLDSLVAADFRSWFRKELQVDIALFDILSAQSIQALIKKALNLITAAISAVSGPADAPSKALPDNDQTKAVDGSLPPMHISEIKKSPPDQGDIPLSTYQSRLWFLHSMAEDKSALVLPIVMFIRGKPHRENLRRAILELCMRNSALRTAYFEGTDFTQQKPVDDFDVNLSMRDFSRLPSPDEALERYVAQSKLNEVDISDGEVTTWCLAKLGDERYALVSMMHHIAVDRGCYKIMMNQVVQLYDAFQMDRDLSTVPSPKLDYIDFTLWHNEYLRSPGVQAHKDWWKSSLAGIPTSSRLLPFSAVPERPSHGDPRRATVKANLVTRLFSRMKRLSTEIKGTPYHFLLAAFRAFHYRYTQDPDLVMLVVDGNRPHPDADDITGFFVNMCPVRCQDECDTTFDQLLVATKDRALEAMSHSFIPFDEIVNLMQVDKTPSHSPISQVIVNYQIHGPAPRFEAADFAIEGASMTDIPTACELSLEALETATHSLDLRIEYSTALYGSEDMQRFVDNFLTFLESVIKDHRQPVEEVDLCGRLEFERLQRNFWNTEFQDSLWSNQTVIDRILDVSRNQPEATALIVSDGTNITYGELSRNATLVASALREAGVESGDRIALACRPCIGAVEGMLGILLARACYVTLDPDFAKERLAFMFQDAGCRAILVGSGGEFVAEEITKLGVSTKVIRVDECIKSPCLLSNLEPRQLSDPFYMIYTSGSTGMPKGVILSESNTHQMLSTLHRDFGFSRADSFLQQSSMAFDLSIVQIFSALCSGARVCIASSETRNDPYALAGFMKQQGVTVTYFTPTQYSLLLESNREALKQCRDYRVAFFAGERLPIRVVKAFYDLATPAVLYNTWSPSELVVQTTIARIDEPDEASLNLPIGKPLSNCRHYILDNDDHPLPLGFVGEIAVGGAQVGQGYLNRPAANRKSFVEDPFCSQDDRRRGWARMFKTGDRGKFRPDGQLEFHGRIAGDKQIKLRGFRVDLGEIEHCIFRNSQSIGKGLVDIAVISRPREDDEQNVQLIAFFVPSQIYDKQERHVFVTELHALISSQLNYYMLPSGYHFLERLPVTIGGKVDRRALLSIDLDPVLPFSDPSNTDENLNDVEKSAIKIFQKVLGSNVGYTRLKDNFFHKGGNSVLLVRLQAELRQCFEKVPTLTQLFQEPTVAAISTFLQSGRATNGSIVANADDAIIDWAAESKVARDSRFPLQHGSLTVPRHEVTAVLIAGTMSRINAHLIAEILHTKPTVRLYVVGLFNVLTAASVTEELGKYGLLKPKGLTESSVIGRITPVRGTLVQGSLGLSKSAFRELGQTVQSIYYLGGEISLLQTYSHLKASHVNALLDLIRLAGTGDFVSELHYLSTWSVAHLQTWPTAQRTFDQIVTTEGDMTHFLPPPGNELGYFKARWVAESLLVKAAERGYPVTLTRASSISALSHSAVSSGSTVNPGLEDFTVQMVRGMVDTGSVPRIGIENGPSFVVDIIPVEYFAAAFVALTTHTAVESDGNGLTVYHLGNPQPLHINDLPEVISQMRPNSKQSVSHVSLEEWLEKMETAPGVEDLDAATVRSTVLKRYFLANGHVMFPLDQTETKRVLDSIAPHLQGMCPSVDADFLDAL
ncbi:hypothetical protein PENVUL_c008G03992 [Penicillium vulpinum]|uniref:Carrier domain-containing protein n=1 Tax=Penicillium vulpinum TaxID=29845 RepID=A0A1V6S412_9EURO|nr:hypothetical protein PENVUL_c008G03992 [Penicillium vulpinum]